MNLFQRCFNGTIPLSCGTPLSLITFLFASLQCATFAELVDYEVMAQSYGPSFANGRKAHVKGNYEEAVVEYTKAINTHPDSMPLYMYRAGCLICLKRNKEALLDVEKYNRLLQKSSDKNDKSMLAAMTLTKARAYDGLGNVDEALKYYKQSMEFVDFPITHKQLGELYKRIGRTEKALDEMVKYRQFLPSTATVKHRDEVDQSIRQLELALTKKKKTTTEPVRKSEPQAAEVLAQDHITLAHKYRDEGNLELARHEFSEAIKLLPKGSQRQHNYFARGLLSIDLKDYASAIADANAIASETDHNGTLRNAAWLRGKAYVGMKRPDDAIRAYAEAEDRLDRWNIQFEYGKLLFEQKKYTEALPRLRKAYDALADSKADNAIKDRAEIARMIQQINSIGEP